MLFKRSEVIIMENSTMSQLVVLTGEDDKKYLLEQYKTLLDSINKLNDVRETSNNFWSGINGALIGTIAYIRDTQSVKCDQKFFFLFTILILGFLLTSFWLSSLVSIKNNLDVKSTLIVELEKYFPAKIFTFTMKKVPGKSENWSVLSLKEMFVPYAFLAGYIIFAILLWITPRSIVPY